MLVNQLLFYSQILVFMIYIGQKFEVIKDSNKVSFYLADLMFKKQFLSSKFKNGFSYLNE